jgi:hypothetical protein
MISGITQQLVLMLKGGIPIVNKPLEWEYLVRVARQSSILARLASLHNESQNLPEYVQQQFDAAIKPSHLLKQQVNFEVQQLVKLVTTDCSSPPIFLKGAAYLLGDFDVGKGRTFSDIDLLVQKSDLPKVEQKLMVFGWVSDKTDEYDQMYYRKWAHEIPPLRHCSRFTLLDVHHNLVPLVSGKAPDIEQFTQDSVPIAGEKAHVLSRHAMTLHSAIHLFYQEEYHHGFRDLGDLHLMFTQFGGIDEYWQKMLELARNSDFELEVALACRYSKLIFDTDIPQKWLDETGRLLPSNLKTAFLDWVFIRVLQPHHQLCNIKFIGFAHFVATIRGHWIKMPIHILIRHTANKVYKNILISFAGKGSLKKSSAEDIE